MATTRTTATPGKTGRPSKLTGEEMVVITRMSARGMSCRTIARLLTRADRSVTAQTIATWLRRAKQPAEELHAALGALRMDAVEAWGLAMRRGARDGRHAPAKDLLIATRVIEAAPDAGRVTIVIGGGVGGHVTIGPALPPIPPDILIAARPVKALPASTPDA